MADPEEIQPTTAATPFRDLAVLRREVDLLHQVIQLLLVGLLIATLGLCLFMYRQTQLLRFQIVAQQAAVIRANQEDQPVLDVLPIFQRLGGRHPDYASNVLAKYHLPTLPPVLNPSSTNTPRGVAKP